jgi:hypothetical protein
MVRVDGDCSVGDLVPGNFQCDLPAGTWGAVSVQNGARIRFGAGTTVLCGLRAGRATRVSSAGPATILVPGRGNIRIGNGSDAGAGCGGLRLVSEAGTVGLGKLGDFALDGCAVGGAMRLGHGNVLRGRFVGFKILGNHDNTGRCCASGSVSTTTTTTTTTITTTTTTIASSTTTSVPGSTTTSGGSTTSTSGTTTSTSGTTTTRPGSTTTTTRSTTTTTRPPSGAFTRTIGFWKNHPAIAQQVLTAAGGVMVCGRGLADVDVGHAHSVVEAMCVAPKGNQRLQLVRQLTAAALNVAAGGAPFLQQATCDAVCRDGAASTAALADCIDTVTGYNESGDAVLAPFDPPGAASTDPCQRAAKTPCTFLNAGACAP